MLRSHTGSVWAARQSAPTVAQCHSHTLIAMQTSHGTLAKKTQTHNTLTSHGTLAKKNTDSKHRLKNTRTHQPPAFRHVNRVWQAHYCAMHQASPRGNCTTGVAFPHFGMAHCDAQSAVLQHTPTECQVQHAALEVLESCSDTLEPPPAKK